MTEEIDRLVDLIADAQQAVLAIEPADKTSREYREIAVSAIIQARRLALDWSERLRALRQSKKTQPFKGPKE